MPVTTPKLPPPPRSPQKRSAFSSLLARTSRAVGGDDVHADDVVRRPAPAPRQVAEPAAQREPRDAGERDEAEDGRRARAPASRDPRRRAGSPPARARSVCCGSTHTPRMSDMSSISAPSAAARPAMLCPPPLMQSRRSCSRANCTHAITSAMPRQRATTAGLRSIMRSRRFASPRSRRRPARAPARGGAPSSR